MSRHTLELQHSLKQVDFKLQCRRYFFFDTVSGNQVDHGDAMASLAHEIDQAVELIHPGLVFRI